MKSVMGFLSLLPALLLAGLMGCGKEQSPPTSSTEETKKNSSNPLTAPVDYLGAVGKAKRTAEKVLDRASLQQAIQKFQALEGRNPEDLDELVAKHYLPATPQPPPGMQIHYNPRTGQVRYLRR